MSKKIEEQLSAQIKETLLNHEEAYVLGSWERFQRYKSRKHKIRRQRLFLAAAAAVLLILTVTFSLMNVEFVPDEQLADHRQTDQPEFAENAPGLPPSEQEAAPLVGRDEKAEPVLSEITDNNKRRSETTLQKPAPDNAPEVTLPASREPVPQYTLTNANGFSPFQTSEKIDAAIHKYESDHSSLTEPEDLASLKYVREEDIRRSLNNIQKKDVVFSVAYAPAVNIHDSQTGLGMGGGFYTDWNFAKNLTVSSGVFVAQNRLKYNNEQGDRLKEDFTQSSESTLSTNDLDYIQLNLVNLEIPLSLRYSLTDEFSVSAGISSMTFLKEQYSYNFKYEQRIQVFEASETTGLQQASRVITLKTIEKQSEPSFDEINWAAFYTFSVGYQRDVFDQYTASFEPFVKIPAGRVTSRGASYMAGGIQLKVSF